MKILVIGTGYVGLVTGACFAYTGNKVTCLDINKDKIKLLKNGKIPIYEPGLSKIVKHSISTKCLLFSTNYEKFVKSSDIIFIAVGTPSKDNGESNLEHVFTVARQIGKHINSYKLIVVKSTVPLGTSFKVQKIVKDEILKRNSRAKGAARHLS